MEQFYFLSFRRDLVVKAATEDISSLSLSFLLSDLLDAGDWKVIVDLKVGVCMCV